MIDKSEILRIIWTDKMIDEAIKNVVDKVYQQDFKSHFILEVSKKDEGDLIQLMKRGELLWYCLKIITNQYKSNTSSFWKEWKNSGLPQSIKVDYKDDMSHYEGREDLCYVDKKEWSEVRNEIERLLLIQYDDFLTNTYHLTLFKMYYFSGKKLKEIKSDTGIDMMAVSRSIKKTKLYLKKEIKLWK